MNFAICVTVECHYNGVQYNKILYAAQQWLRHNLNQCMYILTKDTPYLVLTLNYGLSIVRIWEKMYHVVMAPHCIFLAATKQLYEWSFPSVCLSVCLSVCHTFLTMFPSSYHHEIFRSYYQWQKWRPCKRSRSEVKGQGHRGQHPT